VLRKRFLVKKKELRPPVFPYSCVHVATVASLIGLQGQTLHILSTPARLACSSCTSHPVFHGRWAWECSLKPALTLYTQRRHGSLFILYQSQSSFRFSSISRSFKNATSSHTTSQANEREESLKENSKLYIVKNSIFVKKITCKYKWMYMHNCVTLKNVAINRRITFTFQHYCP